MAELILLRENYWTTHEAEGISERGSDEFFATTHRPYDVIEVKPDGFFRTPTNPKGRGWNKEAFDLLVVPGLDTSIDYTEDLRDVDGKILRLRKYTLENLTPEQKADLASPETTSTLSAVELESTIRKILPKTVIDRTVPKGG